MSFVAHFEALHLTFLLKRCPNFVGSFENLSERYEEKFYPGVKVALPFECKTLNSDLKGALSVWSMQFFEGFFTAQFLRLKHTFMRLKTFFT